MRKVILLKGLPGSGKSTWAKEQLDKYPGKYKRVNKDDLRAMLDNGKWSGDNEGFVLKARDQIILAALEEGKDVLVDDTNLSAKHLAHITQLVVDKATVEEKDFTDVPIETCIERDLKRPNSVGEKVIKRMYNQFLKPRSVDKVIDPTLPYVVLCDLDGTLALFGDANPYDRDFLKDQLNRPVAMILDSINSKVILLSGRSDKFLDQTETWLRENNVKYKALFMRHEGDTRKDVVVKKEMYEKEIEGKYNVEFVLDDRDQVVELWRDLGLTCLQVNYGDF